MSLDAGTYMGRGKAWLDKVLPASVRALLQTGLAHYRAADMRTRYAVLGAGAAAVTALVFIGSSVVDDVAMGVTFTVQRGDLKITVLEGGALEALSSQEIRSGVKGREGAKILSIVEEGYRVTPEDVAAGKILVELDTANLVEQRLNQEIALETAEAAFIERKAQYEIQLNQNVTDLNDARQKMKFARADFEKFLGANVVNRIIADLQIEERLQKAEALDRAEVAAITAQTDSLSIEQVARARFPGPGAGADASLAFDPADIESLPPQFQERLREAMAANGGQLPPEILQRMERMRAGGGFPGGAGGQFGSTEPGQRPSGITDPEAAVALADISVETGTPVKDPGLLKQEPLQSGSPLPVVEQALMDDDYMAIRNRINFSEFADLAVLEDGEAKQRLRSLHDDVQVAEEEFLLAQDRIEGQRRLEARGFITPTELEAEELKINKAVNRQEATRTELNLYKQYTFPKDVDMRLADYENAVMEYLRTLKENIAEEAQEQAQLKSAESKYKLEMEKFADINEQIGFATIRATRPGLVVYGGADQNPWRRGSSSQEAIQEGATVGERQPILTIPDMREMAVKVNIHESAVKRLAAGQQARIKIDAFPNQQLTGEVIRVAVVADSASAFMNPDLKVYPTVLKIHGTYDWLRPGMSAEVEVLVDTLESVIYVPLQAVSYFGDQQVVYVRNGSRVERRAVEIGDFSEQFIEISAGLREGEEVLLLPPPDMARAG